MNITDVVGYVAMILLVLSFIPKKMILIRTINLIACLFFVGYGILLGWAWPIIISNGAVSAVQIYHLFLSKK